MTDGRRRNRYEPSHRVASSRALSLLQSLFGEVRVPPAVVQEAAPSLPVLPSWIVVQPLTQPVASQVLQTALGRGESEALGLALEIKADLVILDDRLARRLALGLGVPVVGTLGILMRAKQAGFVPAVGPLVDRMLELGFRMSAAMRDRVLTDAGERG